MLWSILISAIPERYHSAQPLLYSLLELQSVARMPDVELLYLLDNRRRSAGAKRNALLDAARGEYISFIDDDDAVASDYVSRIRNAIIATRKDAGTCPCKENTMTDCDEAADQLDESVCSCYRRSSPRPCASKKHKDDYPADVLCFPQRATLQPHGVIHECRYSLEYWRRPEAERRQLVATDKPNVAAWTGPPAHTMVWRRAILDGIRFPDKQFGEDVDFVDAACARARTEVQLNCSDPLYLYNFSQDGSATR